MNTKQENTYELNDHVSITLTSEYGGAKNYHYIRIGLTYYNDKLIERIDEIRLSYDEFMKIIEVSKEKAKELEWIVID